MIFLVNSGSFNMIGNLVEGNAIRRGKTYNLEYLLSMGTENLKICVNNPAIMESISQTLGVKLTNNISRISLQPGDILLRIKPSAGVKEYKNDEVIPEGAVSFTLEEWISEK